MVSNKIALTKRRGVNPASFRDANLRSGYRSAGSRPSSSLIVLTELLPVEPIHPFDHEQQRIFAPLGDICVSLLHGAHFYSAEKLGASRSLAVRSEGGGQ